MEEFIDTTFFKNDIFSRLAAKDIYTLSLTCKKFNTFFKDLLKEAILNKINQEFKEIFGDKNNEFKKLLSETNAIITGSFMIQCMLGEYWEGSDIDIFIPVIGNYPNDIWINIDTGIHDFDAEISDINNYTFAEIRPRTIIEDFLFKNITEDCDETPRYSNFTPILGYNILGVCSYDAAKKYKIQVIHVEANKNTNKIKDFVRDTFDFDICKNIYSINNGFENIDFYNEYNVFNKILYYDPKRLFFSDLIDDLNTDEGTCFLENQDFPHSSNERLEKYEGRGFKLIRKT